MALRIGRSRLPELLGDMTQAELARRMGVSRSYISQIISGNQTFSLVKAKEAADILNCYVEDLYEWIYVKGKRPE
jgi:transcriptional regulator with XRE-family HTH domain